jgi:hypothetical protein
VAEGGSAAKRQRSPVGTPEAAAKAVVQEFVAALRDGKKAAILMASDTPYFNHHDFNVIDTREELEHAYEEVFEPWTRSKPLPKAITEISRYRDQRAALREPVRRRLDHTELSGCRRSRRPGSHRRSPDPSRYASRS